MIPAWTRDDLWPDGDKLLIVGPPGTGKTRAVLDHYVWPLLREGKSVLATSFTRAAAEELRERTGREFDRDPGTWRTSLTTMHSESWRRCSGLGIEHGKKERKPEDPEPDREDWHAELAERAEDDCQKGWDIVRHVWPGDIGKPPRQRLARLFSGAKLSEAEAWVMRDLHGRFEDGRLVRPGFTGLLELALSSGCGRSVDLLAVDEAQDLSPLEWELIDLWATGAKRVLVVGDPDQAIFGWAGADGSRLLRWIREGLPARRLAQSWRVPSSAHGFARSIVRLISNREDAPYEPAERTGEVLERDSVEAWRAVGLVQEDERSSMVLARTRAGCAQAVDELIGAGIPHVSERGRAILRPGTNILRVADALHSWCLRSRPIGVEAARVVVKALASKGPILDGMKRGIKAGMDKALRDRDGDVPLAWLRDMGVDTAEIERQWAEPDVEWWKAALLASVVSSADDLMVVRDWLAYYGSTGALMEAAKRVVVTTAHGSKGREADLVVVDARTKMYLPRDGRRKEGELQTMAERRDEDLRCLYVAVTRARESLVVIRGYGARGDWLDMHGISVPRIAPNTRMGQIALDVPSTPTMNNRAKGAKGANMPSSTLFQDEVEEAQGAKGAISSTYGWTF